MTRFYRYAAKALGSATLGIVQIAHAQVPVPFRGSVPAGNIIFLSGQIGIAPAGADPAKEGIDEASRKAMDGVGTELARAGLTFRNVKKCTVMLIDIGALERFNQTYRRYFSPKLLPARSAFQVGGLARGALVEIECVAYR